MHATAHSVLIMCNNTMHITLLHVLRQNARAVSACAFHRSPPHGCSSLMLADSPNRSSLSLYLMLA